VTPEEQAAEVARIQAAEAATKSRTYSESEFKEVVAARDEAKRKLREREEAEQKIQQAKLLEEGKLKELLEAKNKEIESLSNLKDKLAKFEEREAKRAEVEAKHKESLLAKLPEEKRTLYADVPLEALEDVVQSLTQPDPTKGFKPGSSTPDKKYEDYTQEELTELKAKNPEAYRLLYREYYKTKTGRYPV
jgi:hypothetical protein